MPGPDPLGWHELEHELERCLAVTEQERSARLAELRTQDPDLAAALERALLEGGARDSAAVQRAIPTLNALGDAPPVAGLEATSLLSGLRPLPGPAPELGETAGDELAQLNGLEGRRFGPYRVLRLLGRGGMGSVWLAQRVDGLFERQVALKVMHAGLLDTEQRERFSRERQIVGGLRHPQIAQLLEAGVSSDGEPYLALEYVDGTNLAEHCDAQRLSIRQRIVLMQQVLSAVQYAHANLVLHRDLKPSNILVTSAGEIRLLDFGIAKLLSEGVARETDLTALAGRALTPEFASPEQLSGLPLTTASDVYSLGVVLYHLLCGERPYRLARESRGALEEAILRVEPVRPSSRALTHATAELRGATPKRLRRILRGDLDTIVLKALRKDPRARYQTAEAFRQDLERYLAGAPVTARPDGLVYRSSKFLRRNWGRVSAALFVAAALITAAVVSIERARAARAQQAVAEREAQRSQMVLKFLLDLFAKNSDQQETPTLARELTARQLLERGAHDAAQQLRGDPELAAEVLNKLADMYSQLHLGEQAGELRAAAVDALERAFGPRDARVASALLDLAQDVAYTNQRAQARAALTRARAILDALGDESSDARGACWLVSARINRYDSLPALLSDAEQAHRHFARYPSADGWWGAYESLQLAGLGQQIAGHFAAGEALQREAIGTLQARVEYADAWRINPLIHIGECQAGRGQLDQAVATFREALELSRSINGDSNGQTLQTQVKLGGILYGGGQRAEGLAILDATLATLRSNPETDTAGAWSSLRQFRGLVMFAEGQVEEAEELWRAEVDDRRKVFPGSLPLARALVQHAVGALALGRYAEADAELEEGCRLWQERSGGAAASALSNDCWLGRARLELALGQPSQAGQWLERVVALPEPVPLSVDLVEAGTARAQSRLQLADAEGAQRAARAALGLLEASGQRARYPRLEAAARLRLGQALCASGGPRDALRELQTSVDLFASHGNPASPWLGEARVALGRCWLGAQPSAAERQRAVELLAVGRASAAAHPRLGKHLERVLLELPAPSVH
jgi:serine/threonine-protein kinase